jgi:hypothetical protein
MVPLALLIMPPTLFVMVPFMVIVPSFVMVPLFAIEPPTFTVRVHSFGI